MGEATKSHHKEIWIQEGVEIVTIFAVYHMTTLKNCQYFLKLSICIPFDPIIAFLDIYLKDTFIRAQKRHTGMFIATPFIIAPNANYPNTH